MPQHSFLGSQTYHCDLRLFVFFPGRLTHRLVHESNPPQIPTLHPPQDTCASELLSTGSRLAATFRAVRSIPSANNRSVFCFKNALPAGVHRLHSPCSGISNPRAFARRCATSHKNSTGDSGSPFSNSPFAGHMLQTEWSRHDAHLDGRVRFCCRTSWRNLSQPARTLPPRISYVSRCESTQILICPYGSMAKLLSPPPQP